MKMTPYLKETVWAGRRLATRYGGDRIGEAYLLSAVPGRCSRLDDGESFDAYLRRRGREAASFPLLIKAIDAAGILSLQVHPGKDELWLITHTYGDAAVARGFRRAVTAAEVAAACKGGTVASLLRWERLHVGDVVFLPAGTVHTVVGAAFFEIQTNDDTTYRLYDFGRDRPLQREAALAAADLSGAPPTTASPFHLRFLRADGPLHCPAATALLSLTATGHCQNRPFAAGDCLYRDDSVVTLTAKGTLVAVTLPET